LFFLVPVPIILDLTLILADDPPGFHDIQRVHANEAAAFGPPQVDWGYSSSSAPNPFTTYGSYTNGAANYQGSSIPGYSAALTSTHPIGNLPNYPPTTVPSYPATPIPGFATGNLPSFANGMSNFPAPFHQQTNFMSPGHGAQVDQLAKMSEGAPSEAWVHSFGNLNLGRGREH